MDFVDVESLRSVCLKCEKCELFKGRTNVVFGKGNVEADIMFIGEAPGENEDLEGIPFVGRAGKQLDRLLKRIGFTIDDVYVANILKCRPPNNRNPRKEEIVECTKYLREQIKLIRPKVIATLGNYATKFVLGGFSPENMDSVDGISRIHGKPKRIRTKSFSFVVVPIFHPAAMLYKPQLAELFEKDFVVMKKVVEGNFVSKKSEVQKGLV